MAYKEAQKVMDKMMDVSREKGYMGMISEDMSAPANLPQNVIQKEYPRCEYASYDLDDTIKEIDSNKDDSVRKVQKNKSKSMY